RSDTFRYRWARHDVRHHRAGLKRVHHPAVGDLELSYQAMEFPANPDWFMFAFTAEPGSASQERIKLLGSLAATPETAAGLWPRRDSWTGCVRGVLIVPSSAAAGLLAWRSWIGTSP